MHEFEIIKNYFAQQKKPRADVSVGIGDDGAIVKIPAQHELVITTDTLIHGVHFPEATTPFDIGHKALAVNLSDLAAMGATPAWVTLALTLPQADEAWIKAFCAGFFALAEHYQIQLIGGDLTRGPLVITVQALGWVPTDKAILRSGAKPGDLIYVTGTLGDAGLALKFLQDKIALTADLQASILPRLNRPEPRVVCGENLRGLAHAAIDISDGLAADLGHILEASNVGARLFVPRLPLSKAMKQTLPSDEAIALALAAGDDYELCFTLPPENGSKLEEKFAALSCSYTCIGEIVKQPGLTLSDENGNPYNVSVLGYQHF